MNLAVFFGGKSSEHDISIITAMQVLKAINKNKYNVIPIYINKDGKWYSGEELYNIDAFIDFDETKYKQITLNLSNGELLKKGIFGYFWAKTQKNSTNICAISSLKLCLNISIIC